MNREAGELELIVGEEYRYNGRVYVITGVSRGFVELHSTTHPSDIRLQTREHLEQAAKRKRFVQVREAPFTGRYHQIVAALDQESRAAIDRRTEYVRTAVEQFNSRLPRKGCEVLIAEVKVLLGGVRGPCFNTMRNLHLRPAQSRWKAKSPKYRHRHAASYTATVSKQCEKNTRNRFSMDAAPITWYRE